MNTSKIAIIEELLPELDDLVFGDRARLDAIKRKTEMYTRNIFGETSKYLNDLRGIRFYPQIYPTTHITEANIWKTGVNEMKNLVQTMIEELNLFGDVWDNSINESNIKTKKSKNSENTSKVFIVHGRNDVIKLKVARFTEKLGLKPVILHEQANNGRTIIEKFEGIATDIDFAIVLLTGDDEGKMIGDESTLNLRARQNVIFELGYFIGKMGRSNVVALKEKGIELPSDYAGILYIDIDNKDSWKLELAKEMRHAGLSVDLNNAI